METIEGSVSSLHNRRSILIKDDIKEKIWVIHGSGVADTTRQSGEKCAKRINGELGFQYHIEEVDYSDAEQFVTTLLQRKESKKPEKPTETSKTPTITDQAPKSQSKTTPGVRRTLSHTSIPKVPDIVKKAQDDKIVPKADQDTGEGPEIKEFQISYYQDTNVSARKTSREPVQTVDTTLVKEVLYVVQEYIRNIENIMLVKPEKSQSVKQLSDLSDKILNIIYS